MIRTAEWPYDAYRDDPLAALRVLAVGSPWPGWKYEVCLVCPADAAGQDLYPARRPDDAEATMIMRYIDFRREWYNEGWRARMLASPLDTDSGTNTVVLWKRGDGDWCYRRMTWQTGPLMFPPRGDETHGPLTLSSLLDKINEHSSRWDVFKSAHSGAFPASIEEAGQ
jgi:hypothetical protein